MLIKQFWFWGVLMFASFLNAQMADLRITISNAEVIVNGKINIMY